MTNQNDLQIELAKLEKAVNDYNNSPTVATVPAIDDLDPFDIPETYDDESEYLDSIGFGSGQDLSQFD